ncbi:uncharacterized protein [Rutidosis leptorrhynchoides]|uniref:uncharacterized protein n=1 Tax=Rutidosis leptorrhynchoides TaxID=125765 RepID=UPI003A98D016
MVRMLLGREEMDRNTWMYEIGRATSEFMDSVDEFITVAETDQLEKGNTAISCPCKKCKNARWYADSTDIKSHLIAHGFMRGYTCWSFHGESLADLNPSGSDNDTDNEDDSYNSGNNVNFDDMFDDLDMEDNVADKYHDRLQQLFVDAEKPLYTGCMNFSKLSAVIQLVNLKSNNGWSDTSFTSLLELLNKLLPEGNELPVSTYQAKKLMCPMGLEIQRIHACPNDCMLYRNEDKDLHQCKVCGTSRYKRGKPTDNVDSDVSENGPPAKLLWYLPIIPRLKRLFANEKDEKLLRWHAEDRKNDGKMRHVADSLQWKNFDKDFEEFGDKIRNIRFRLSSDGINLFGDLSSRHSTWPVLLCIYNLPPWLCMKRKYIMMSLLIQGPKEPGNDIDVYLQPLVDEMMELWSTGIHVYDAYKKEYFQLRAMLFCTINDFPAYGNLSGYSTKGKKACPIYEENTHSIWLTNCKKPAFMGHRRELAENHPYRKKADLFDGTIEDRKLPAPLDGETTLSKVANIKVVWGKKGFGPPKGIWKKKSIFWKLPYWKHLRVRHCIDVMHFEKNVCESLIGLLLNIPGKIKDGIKVRRDMELMNIRPELQPKDIDGRTGYDILRGIKVPSGYSANIRKLVSMKDLKLLGMKSHDCHVIDPDVLDEYQRDIILTLCELEIYFPPSFFDVMVHLVSHIVGEIKACGPVFLCVGIPQSHHEGRLAGQGTLGRKTGYSNVADYQEAHFNVLQHTTSIDPFIQEHMAFLRQQNPKKRAKWLANQHKITFSEWLKDKVRRTLPNIDKTIEALGFVPKHVFQYQGYDINRYTF